MVQGEGGYVGGRVEGEPGCAQVESRHARTNEAKGLWQGRPARVAVHPTASAAPACTGPPTWLPGAPVSKLARSNTAAISGECEQGPHHAACLASRCPAACCVHASEGVGLGWCRSWVKAGPPPRGVPGVALPRRVLRACERGSWIELVQVEGESRAWRHAALPRAACMQMGRMG